MCNSSNLEITTENFARLDILTSVYTNTAHVLSIGIGYGDTAKIAKANAVVGMHQAKIEGGNRAYVVYSPDDMFGPIEPNETNNRKPNIFDSQLEQIAETSGLSVNTVFKIDCLVKQKNKRNFTSIELAKEIGVSVRTANRIIVKLEQCGYIVEVGRHVISERGRPTRVVKVVF
ncbi:helix-turn-helix domain-containing protein [Brevibacillus centrosporus]